MKKIVFLAMCTAALVTTFKPASAQTTVNLPVFSTGVNSSGNLLSNSTVDTHWTATNSGGPTLTVYANATAQNPGSGSTPTGSGDWVAGGSNYQWDSVEPIGSDNAPGTQYTFTQTFNVAPNSILNTGLIDFDMTSDNAVSEVLLNGVVIDNLETPTPNQNNISYATLYGPFTIDAATDAATGAAFVDGTNTLSFVTLNQPSTPEGLLVDITQATIEEAVAAGGGPPQLVPEPSETVALLIGSLSLIGLMTVNRREKSATFLS